MEEQTAMGNTYQSFASQDAIDTHYTTTTAANPLLRGTPDIESVMEKPYARIALWVCELRRRFNLTQYQMAQSLGVSSATVGSWERADSQPIDPKHRTALTRAGQAMKMPALPDPVGTVRSLQGPRIDPKVEELFKQHFGSV